VKRKILVIVTVTVVSLLVTAVFVYSQISELQNQISKLQAQNKELQDQTSELEDQVATLQAQNSGLQDKLDEKCGVSPVQITGTERVGWYPIGGVTIASAVIVTVWNNGSTDISGLTLTVRLLSGNNEVNAIGRGFVTQIDGLRAGESREFSGTISYRIDSAFMVESTITLGDVFLDEYRTPNR